MCGKFPPSPAAAVTSPFGVAFTAHFHWGPVTRVPHEKGLCAAQALWLSGSDPALGGDGCELHKLLRLGEDQLSAEGFWTPRVLDKLQCLQGITSTAVQFIISFNFLKRSNFYTIVKGSLFTMIAKGNISSMSNHGNE